MCSEQVWIVRRLELTNIWSFAKGVGSKVYSKAILAFEVALLRLLTLFGALLQTTVEFVSQLMTLNLA